MLARFLQSNDKKELRESKMTCRRAHARAHVRVYVCVCVAKLTSVEREVVVSKEEVDLDSLKSFGADQKPPESCTFFGAYTLSHA